MLQDFQQIAHRRLAAGAHIHISGVCGTFMGGVAQLATQLGYRVTGSDKAFYPPMSDQLRLAGIETLEGFSEQHLEPAPDLVIIGNALSRGNVEVEAVLNRGLSYLSGAQWLSEFVLPERWVVAVAGTHGKTTTSSLVAWLLESADLAPGFLIGGVPGNFDCSARLGSSPFFVVEADEYDTAFFDKRSKFVHYHARTAILNNLEFDHADIFDDLAAIQKQFHHFIRTVPNVGRVICLAEDDNLQAVLAQGLWTPLETFGIERDADWHGRLLADESGEMLSLSGPGLAEQSIRWQQLGVHNANNALAAVAASRHCGVPTEVSLAALPEFKGVKRRLEHLLSHAGIELYDDFAHHPTAIEATVGAIKDRGVGRCLVVLELRSNSMRMGAHLPLLPEALQAADQVFLYDPADVPCDTAFLQQSMGARLRRHEQLQALVRDTAQNAQSGDCIVVMSNGAFGGVQDLLTQALLEL